MPELPEVEASRRAVQEHCCGKVIKKAVVADDPKVIENVSPSDLEKALVGKKLVAAHRKGKHLWLQLDSPPFPSFQFGMTGAIYMKGINVVKYKRSVVNDEDDWPSKFSKVFIEFDDGVEMSFTDKRRFARVRLLENPESTSPISELGPDALLELLPEETFIAELKKKNIAIKALMLDQSFISGIGNWVADEVLYQARIHPAIAASALPEECCKALHNSIKQVIQKALDVGGDSNQYPENWIFHNREGKPGKAFVEGKRIDFITVGGRTSAYVPELQKYQGDVHAVSSAKDGEKMRDKQTRVKKKSQGTEMEGEEAVITEVDTETKKSGKKSKQTKKGEILGNKKKIEEASQNEEANIPTKRRRKQPKNAHDGTSGAEEGEQPSKSTGAVGEEKVGNKRARKANVKEIAPAIESQKKTGRKPVKASKANTSPQLSGKAGKNRRRKKDGKSS
eukprot:TRINITY_DN12403_c0_g1_i1.p1 TRINITY_DN12403_c0_g1~~TRINITY_DN12403_c0_g1_i1.p1  ORF type:complete len:451 (-),score=135.08 TRINITY_DN12403_c0_g1_i1:100-1452(-)